MDLNSILYYFSLGLMSFLYVFAGVSHFRAEKFFLKMMPPFIPSQYHKAIVLWSGVVEIALGLLLWLPMFRVYAAWGIIMLLIVVYPANIYMLVARIKGEKFKRMPVYSLWIRLVLQIPLIYWAYSFTA